MSTSLLIIAEVLVLVVVSHVNSPAHIALRVTLIVDHVGRAHVGRPLDDARLTLETGVLEDGAKLRKRVVSVGSANVVGVCRQPSTQSARRIGRRLANHSRRLRNVRLITGRRRLLMVFRR